MHKKILIVSDTWLPQINGVARTLDKTVQTLRTLGHEITTISPDQFTTIPCPTYPELRLAIRPARQMGKLIEAAHPDCIHISTEGPLGLAARRYCHTHKLPFTTAFHTRFPEYVHARLGIPNQWTYKLLRWFHSLSSHVMVATGSLHQELESRGFRNLVRWSRGVDLDLFYPREKGFLTGTRPVFMYVGRVAVEKNIEAFLRLQLPGSQYVVGNGPQLESLKLRYPHVHFVGAKTGTELAQYYAAADVLVFPSLTDTFGLVMLEAMASGVPVAAYPVSGPLDVVGDSGAGCLDDDLTVAAQRALEVKADVCREHALNFSWQACTRQFVDNLMFFDQKIR